jgi:hypothetical protein
MPVRADPVDDNAVRCEVAAEPDTGGDHAPPVAAAGRDRVEHKAHGVVARARGP